MLDINQRAKGLYVKMKDHGLNPHDISIKTSNGFCLGTQFAIEDPEAWFKPVLIEARNPYSESIDTQIMGKALAHCICSRKMIECEEYPELDILSELMNEENIESVVKAVMNEDGELDESYPGPSLAYIELILVKSAYVNTGFEELFTFSVIDYLGSLTGATVITPHLIGEEETPEVDGGEEIFGTPLTLFLEPFDNPGKYGFLPSNNPELWIQTVNEKG